MYKKEKYIESMTDYLKNNLKKGYTLESLKWALINQGYAKIEVEKAIKRVQTELATQAPILKAKPEIKIEPIPIEPKKSFWKSLFG
jgi:hypothetical protein